LFRAPTLFADWGGEEKLRVKRSQWGGSDDDTFSAISFKLIEKSNNLQLPQKPQRWVGVEKPPQGKIFYSLFVKHRFKILYAAKEMRDGDIWESSNWKSIHHKSRLHTWLKSFPWVDKWKQICGWKIVSTYIRKRTMKAIKLSGLACVNHIKLPSNIYDYENVLLLC
jgi:hypothetical protein